MGCLKYKGRLFYQIILVKVLWIKHPKPLKPLLCMLHDFITQGMV
ncbi:hypothetical protein [Moraxella lacunata]